MEINIKDGYKVTEVGVIPDDWEVKKLKDCLIQNPDYGINAPAVPYLDNLPTYIRITDISEDGNFLAQNKVSVIHHNANNYFLEFGDIVLARTGASTGKSYLYNVKDGKLVFAGFLIRVKPDTQKLYPRYLKGCLETQAYWNWVKVMSMRSGQPGINSNEYSQLQIPLPPLAEQKAIAHALSDVDNLITAIDQLITKKRNIKQGTMQELLTGKKRLPGFSGKWEVKKLGDIGECIIGLTYKPENVKESGLLVLRSSNIADNQLKFDDTVFVDVEVTDKLMTKEGDILICVRNGSRQLIGKNALIDKKSEGLTFGAFMSVYRTKFYKYIFHAFQTNEIKKQIHENIGATINQITNKNLNSFEISLPPQIEEQKAIAEILTDIDKEIEALEKNRDKYKALKQGMMQELLTGKTRIIDN
ncbi:MAG: restriction endonuclease subunit S [Dolichospermum circinale Clear-D4]|nr:restriction endonuclease subunit S [Dolichospermum circinale Clear-D4]